MVFMFLKPEQNYKSLGFLMASVGSYCTVVEETINLQGMIICVSNVVTLIQHQKKNHSWDSCNSSN